MPFQPFPKVPRLSREMLVTEKIDGTNASIHVVSALEAEIEDWPVDKAMVRTVGSYIFAGSRKRLITPDADNFGFARWVCDHSQELMEGLGYGSHYGEWWGKGIQRSYGLETKVFSLFNVNRWNDAAPPPECCQVVPLLYRGEFCTVRAQQILSDLELSGSMAALGYDNPEGIMVFHVASQSLFKKTFEGDQQGK